MGIRKVRSTRLDDEETAVIRRAAAEVGLTFSVFLRRSGLQCARRQLVAPGVVVRGTPRMPLTEREEVAPCQPS
jgi:uncharacterized protein (DUF1778 family)